MKLLQIILDAKDAERQAGRNAEALVFTTSKQKSGTNTPEDVERERLRRSLVGG